MNYLNENLSCLRSNNVNFLNNLFYQIYLVRPPNVYFFECVTDVK